MSGLVKFYPDEALTVKCKLCESEEDFEKARDLEEVLKTTTEMMNGAGLAANQIGETLRVAVINPKADVEYEGDQEMFLAINPEILEKEDLVEIDEGCLSLPGASAKVDRYNKVKVKYLTTSKKEVIADYTGVYAQIWQHEIDHLDGKLYVDQFGKMKKEIVLNKVKKFLRNPMANIKRMGGSRL